MPSPLEQSLPSQVDPKLPDLVDRIFEYLLETNPSIQADASELKASIRAEFGGQTQYIHADVKGKYEKRLHEVLRLFNGRNATEVARKVGISRPTVYRYLKQAGGNHKKAT